MGSEDVIPYITDRNQTVDSSIVSLSLKLFWPYAKTYECAFSVLLVLLRRNCLSSWQLSLVTFSETCGSICYPFDPGTTFLKHLLRYWWSSTSGNTFDITFTIKILNPSEGYRPSKWLFPYFMWTCLLAVVVELVCMHQLTHYAFFWTLRSIMSISLPWFCWIHTVSITGNYRMTKT